MLHFRWWHKSLLLCRPVLYNTHWWICRVGWIQTLASFWLEQRHLFTHIHRYMHTYLSTPIKTYVILTTHTLTYIYSHPSSIHLPNQTRGNNSIMEEAGNSFRNLSQGKILRTPTHKLHTHCTAVRTYTPTY